MCRIKVHGSWMWTLMRGRVSKMCVKTEISRPYTIVGAAFVHYSFRPRFLRRISSRIGSFAFDVLRFAASRLKERQLEDGGSCIQMICNKFRELSAICRHTVTHHGRLQTF